MLDAAQERADQRRSNRRDIQRKNGQTVEQAKALADGPAHAGDVDSAPSTYAADIWARQLDNVRQQVEGAITSLSSSFSGIVERLDHTIASSQRHSEEQTASAGGDSAEAERCLREVIEALRSIQQSTRAGTSRINATSPLPRMLEPLTQRTRLKMRDNGR